jgi:GntR family transcriptional regulator, rspAB operon transcriptional repressor
MSTPSDGFMLDPARPLAAQVYEQVRRAILTGQLPAGSALSEADLSTRFGTSRTPCRESLIRLAEEGLVAIYAQRGTVVAPIDADGVRQAQFIREALEVAVIGQLAALSERPPLDGVRALLHEQTHVAEAHRYDRFFELDEAFHRELCGLAGRAPVWPLIAGVKTQLDRVRYLSLPNPCRIADILTEHQAIIAAVATGDVAGAQEAMRVHVRAVLGSLGNLPTAPQPPRFRAADRRGG